MKGLGAALLVAGVTLPIVPAAAQSVADPALVPPVAASAETTLVASAPSPICADRPTEATVVCTVPQGDVQIEADAINRTRFSGGVDADTIPHTDPTIKHGLGATTGVEVNVAAYETVRVRRRGASDALRGVGDPYVRVSSSSRRRRRSTPASAPASEPTGCDGDRRCWT